MISFQFRCLIVTCALLNLLFGCNPFTSPDFETCDARKLNSPVLKGYMSEAIGIDKTQFEVECVGEIYGKDTLSIAKLFVDNRNLRINELIATGEQGNAAWDDRLDKRIPWLAAKSHRVLAHGELPSGIPYSIREIGENKVELLLLFTTSYAKYKSWNHFIDDIMDKSH